MLQMTHKRLSAVADDTYIHCLTGKQYTQMVQEHLPQMPTENILSEPIGKSSAPPILWAALELMKIDSDAVMIICPSDHTVGDEPAFIKALEDAVRFATEHDALLTLGITPHRPHTGYGYIHYDRETSEGKVFSALKFTEKPDLGRAQRFMASGNYLWNAGIFVWKASVIIEAFKRFQPKMHEQFTTMTADEAFAACEEISIDYAILEHANNIFVRPVTCAWSDVGTWGGLWEELQKNGDGNVVVGNNNVQILNTENTLIISQNPDSERLIAIEGLTDICVVDTGDVLLVCNRHAESALKKLRKSLGEKERKQYW